jgi:hypothetical protein
VRHVKVFGYFPVDATHQPLLFERLHFGVLFGCVFF